jgi:hypothetical protein
MPLLLDLSHFDPVKIRKELLQKGGPIRTTIELLKNFIVLKERKCSDKPEPAIIAFDNTMKHDTLAFC